MVLPNATFNHWFFPLLRPIHPLTKRLFSFENKKLLLKSKNSLQENSICYSLLKASSSIGLCLSADTPNELAMLLTSAIIATTSFSLFTADPTPCIRNSHKHQSFIPKRINGDSQTLKELLTTPAAPAVTAIGAVTALSPDEHITGILTAREIEYAAASVGVACIYHIKTWAI